MFTPDPDKRNILFQINPYIRRAWYDTMRPNAVIQERIIYDYEILFIKSGSATITIDGKIYNAVPGDLYFFRPGQPHAIFVGPDAPLVQPHIHFDFIYRDKFSQMTPISFKNFEQLSDSERALIQPDITEQIFHDFPSYIRLDNLSYVEQLLFDVIYAFEQKDMYWELRVKRLFLHLIDQLLYELHWQKARHTSLCIERAQHIKLYLEHHTDRRISLEELSRIYHIDRSYISHIYRQVYHISPIRYHLLLRLEKAKRMIRFTNIPLSDIAEQTGFSTLQDFSRAFKKEEGIPPSAFRKASPG